MGGDPGCPHLPRFPSANEEQTKLRKSYLPFQGPGEYFVLLSLSGLPAGTVGVT